MSMPWRAAWAISALGSAPSRRRVKAQIRVERVPLRQCTTTGCDAECKVAAKASTSARVNVAAVNGMW